MRTTTLIAIAATLFFAGRPAAAQTRPDLSPQAAAYLTAALDTLESAMLGRDTLSWTAIRDSAFLLAAGARAPRDTYGAIAWALRRSNRHSFLQASTPGAVSELIDGRFGYVRVPQRGGTAVALADSLHDAVRALGAAGACGWIVDLRGNGGGNMWPMLAGIGPLLGDSLVGRFGVDNGNAGWFYRMGVSGLRGPDGTVDTVSAVTVAPVAMVPSSSPVAVLFDGGTGSSGEAVAVAFLGRPGTRTFGTPSAGFATANRGSRLPDGANMVITTGYYTDRRGIEHADQLEPDSLVEAGVTGWPFATDPVAKAAAAWLAGHAACRGSEVESAVTGDTARRQ